MHRRILDQLTLKSDWRTRVELLREMRETRALTFETVRAVNANIAQQLVSENRSQVILETLETCKAICDRFSEETSFPTLADAYATRALVLTNASNFVAVAAFQLLVKIVTCQRRGMKAFYERITETAVSSKSSNTRKACIELLGMALATYSPTFLARKGVSEAARNALNHALRDPDLNVRAAARDAFWCFHAAYPLEGKAYLDERVTADERKLLESQRPTSLQEAGKVISGAVDLSLRVDEEEATARRIANCLSTALTKVAEKDDESAHGSLAAVPSLCLKLQPRSESLSSTAGTILLSASEALVACCAVLTGRLDAAAANLTVKSLQAAEATFDASGAFVLAFSGCKSGTVLSSAVTDVLRRVVPLAISSRRKNLMDDGIASTISTLGAASANLKLSQTRFINLCLELHPETTEALILAPTSSSVASGAQPSSETSRRTNVDDDENSDRENIPAVSSSSSLPRAALAQPPKNEPRVKLSDIPHGRASAELQLLAIRSDDPDERKRAVDYFAEHFDACEADGVLARLNLAEMRLVRCFREGNRRAALLPHS